jgi:hypothetical protein
MKTIYYTATSLDGFIAGPNNSLDWLFKLEGNGDRDYPDFIRDVGAIAMGSTTYEWILAYEKLLEGNAKAWRTSSPPGSSPRESSRQSPAPTFVSCRETSGRCTRTWCRPRTGRTCGWWAAVSWLAGSTITGFSTSSS